MNRPSLPTVSRAGIDDCWNRIGVHGDSSCPRLEQHIHCRNCPIYSAAAVHLLDAAPPPGYLDDCSHELAQHISALDPDTRSVLVFRIGVEWLALPTSALQEIAGVRATHSIPHRRDGALLGLVNIRGELLLCVSLQRLLALGETNGPTSEEHRVMGKRLLVIQREGRRAVCPVDEVHGIRHFLAEDFSPVPATIARAAAAYTEAVLSWEGRAVGLLDAQLLFHTVDRSVA